jgi:NDP-sugar pyrophosphorylase family protein
VKAGILAAGLGERLRADGVETPKALLRVAGRPLLAHALAAVAAAGAEDAFVAVNERDAAAVERYLASAPPPLPVRLLRRSTASSLETFANVASALLAEGATHALIAMVDGVFPAGALPAFAAAAARIVGGDPAGVEGLIGVTRRPDDDRPLRVLADACGRILAIGSGAGASPLATAGLYLLPERALRRGPELLADGGGALRELLSSIVREGMALVACELGDVVDVDRLDDLEAAEELAGCA